jgi:hypothetical protein
MPSSQLKSKPSLARHRQSAGSRIIITRPLALRLDSRMITPAQRREERLLRNSQPAQPQPQPQQGRTHSNPPNFTFRLSPRHAALPALGFHSTLIYSQCCEAQIGLSVMLSVESCMSGRSFAVRTGVRACFCSSRALPSWQ